MISYNIIMQETVDYSRISLKRLEKANEDESKATINLILDHNELQRLDNVDSFARVEYLSICNNLLVRMYGVSKLANLRVLNLDNNGILQIEGLKDLVYLKTLKLSGNNIKSIEHLNNNLHLEHLDLSNNQIAYMAEISYLKSLKHLNLSRNKLSELRQCDRYLPTSLEFLGLAQNNITDLNEISHLVQLKKLDHLTVQGNPCLQMDSVQIGFDYRPFVINWIMSLKTLDGYVVSAIESLKAEWLYSQGKGRQFSPGEHEALCQYLSSTCPVTAEALDTEDQRKLRLILSKAQQHQQQLKEQTNTPPRSRIQSPRLQSRASNRSSDRMSNSFHVSTTPRHNVESVMSASFTAMSAESDRRDDSSDSSFCQSVTNSQHDSMSDRSRIKIANNRCKEPLEAASKMVPVLESLMSPDFQQSMFSISSKHANGHSDESQRSCSPASCKRNSKGSPKLSRSALSSPKMKQKAEQRKGSFSSRTNLRPSSEKDNKDEVNRVKMQNSTKAQNISKENKNGDIAVKINRSCKPSCEVIAAVTIQKMWRGYRIRNLHRDTVRILHAIQAARAKQHIERLTSDMEATKSALESERKIQQLQMQAINALWRKISTIQCGGDKNLDAPRPANCGDVANTMKNLAETCLNLQNQVTELQQSMQTVLNNLNGLKGTNSNVSQTASQTDIVAVTTPQAEKCPYLSAKRPQTLPLHSHSDAVLNQSEDSRASIREPDKRKSEIIETENETSSSNVSRATNKEEPATNKSNSSQSSFGNDVETVWDNCSANSNTSEDKKRDDNELACDSEAFIGV